MVRISQKEKKRKEKKRKEKKRKEKKRKEKKRKEKKRKVFCVEEQTMGYMHQETDGELPSSNALHVLNLEYWGGKEK
jgi:hypothetical protein